MSLHVTVRDEQTGDVEEVRVPDGEYQLIVTKPCRLANAQTHGNGTHVLTIKDHDPQPLPPLGCAVHNSEGEAVGGGSL